MKYKGISALDVHSMQIECKFYVTKFDQLKALVYTKKFCKSTYLKVSILPNVNM